MNISRRQEDFKSVLPSTTYYNYNYYYYYQQYYYCATTITTVLSRCTCDFRQLRWSFASLHRWWLRRLVSASGARPRCLWGDGKGKKETKKTTNEIKQLNKYIYIIIYIYIHIIFWFLLFFLFSTKNVGISADSKALCEQLAERLEKEKFDIRSAVARQPRQPRQPLRLSVPWSPA